jgi:hypothetical protein
VAKLHKTTLIPSMKAKVMLPLNFSGSCFIIIFIHIQMIFVFNNLFLNSFFFIRQHF